MSASNCIMSPLRPSYELYGTQLSDAAPLSEKLESAIAEGDLESVKQILLPLTVEEKKKMLNRKGKDNAYPLTKAIESRSPEVMKLLIMEGAQFKPLTWANYDAIMLAFRNKDINTITLILQHIDQADFLRHYNEMVTACRGEVDLIRMLLAHKLQIARDPLSLLPAQLAQRPAELRQKDGVWWKCVSCLQTEEGCIYRFLFWPNGNPRPFPAVEPNFDQLVIYFPDQLLALNLGYHREVEGGHSFVELPDADVLTTRAARLEIGDSLGIVSSEVIAEDLDYATLVASGHIPLSTGAEFFHDHAAHIVRRILNLVEGYKATIQQIEQGIGELVRVARQAEAIFNLLPNGICDYTQDLTYGEISEGIWLKTRSIEESRAMNLAMLQRLKATVGVTADLISATDLSKQSNIDYLIPLINFDVIFVLKKMWNKLIINAYLTQRFRADGLGSWSFMRQPEFDRFLRKVLDNMPPRALETDLAF